MTDISLVTSLYKTGEFLPRYAENVIRVARAVHDAGIRLEMVIIPNDASEAERTILTDLRDSLQAEAIATVQIHYVPLETLYATWNRGIQAATGKAIGIWNVDDVRTPAGLIEGYRLIVEEGYELVDFPVHYVISDRVFGIPVTRERYAPPQYNPDLIHPKSCTGPFFMFAPVVYERAGEFDPRYKISGEFEWCMLDAVRQSRVTYGEKIAGTFYLHGNNITQSSSLSEWVVYNVALLRLGVYEPLRPVDPVQMKSAWETWGNNGTTVPERIQEWLWGAGAAERFHRYRWERNLPPLVRRIFLALARRGLVRSIDWDLNHGRQTPG